MKRQYRNLVSIPARTLGDFSITHEQYLPGHEFELANFRCRALGGQRNKCVAFPDATTLHRLTYPGGVMRELPCEIEQHYNCLKPIKRGRVLVGGLGIGLALAILPRACDITVVELSPEVIGLVRPSIRRPVTIINADILDYMGDTESVFDWAFFDTWASDSEHTFFSVVVPLLEKSFGKIHHRPVCWNEDVMRGQLAFGLARCFDLVGSDGFPTLGELATPRGNSWWDWKVPFWRGVQDGRFNQGDASLYASIYGLPEHRDLWYMPPVKAKRKPRRKPARV